jgi:hypothetical protein
MSEKVWDLNRWGNRPCYHWNQRVRFARECVPHDESFMSGKGLSPFPGCSGHFIVFGTLNDMRAAYEGTIGLPTRGLARVCPLRIRYDVCNFLLP